VRRRRLRTIIQQAQQHDAQEGSDMSSSRTTTITLRVSHQLLERIEHSARRHGEDRNTYILNWIPENYEPHGSGTCDTENGAGVTTARLVHTCTARPRD
jgi:hypothetical protein